MVNFGPVAAEIGWRVYGTSANFNRFRVLASLLHRRRSTEVNQTLHDVWGPCLTRECCHVQNSLRPSLAFSYIGSVTARHSSTARQPNIAAVFDRGRHLYSAGRPSPWSSAHIVVYFFRFWATVCKTVRPMLSDRDVCPVCDVGVLWSNGCTDQDETWHAGSPRPWPYCVRWGPSSPSPKGAQPPPNFRPISVAAKRLHGSRCHLVWS